MLLPSQFKIFIAELQYVHRLLQDQTSAIRDASKASIESKDDPLPTPLPVTAKLQFPEGHERNEQSRHDDSYSLQRWLTVGTWLAFGAAVIYAGIAACQLREAHRQSEAAQKTLCEVQKQTVLMRQQLVGTQAAVVEHATPTVDDGKTGTVSESLSNHGLVTAKDVRLDITETLERLSDLHPLYDPIEVHKGPEDVRTGEKLVLEWHTPWEAKIKNMVSPQGPAYAFSTWPKEWPGTETIEYRGSYSYDNGFGDKKTGTFCYRVIPSFAYQIPSNPGVYAGIGIGGVTTCDDIHNFVRTEFAKKSEYETKR